MDQVDRLRTALADRYELDHEIGAGGMAHVYHAHDRQHNRDVAIKVLRPELAAAIGIERFLREIHIEARLQHPNILPLHDSGSVDGLLYYVMPYVEGETLRGRIKREKQLPVAEAVRITREVAEALDYAHRHNVVHRDIKPGNILLSGGHAMVADFGLARAVSVSDEESLTGSGIAVGTAEYMSPEQASGEREVDGRSDIYALGCVLYEMLAGDPPFTGRTVQSVLARHRHDPPPRLSVVRPGLPPQLEEAVERTLAKVPADRFPTAGDLSEALARPTVPGAPRRSKKWRRIAVAASLAGLAGFGLWRLAGTRSDSTDPNKVMVFPLVDRTAQGQNEGAGEEVAIMIGSALEHTEPLKWIDGWTWMDPAQRENARLLSPHSARILSRKRQARFYIDGSIVRARDSATVVLRLNDAQADSVVVQASAAGSSDAGQLPQLGLRAMVDLLPALLQPGHRLDPSAFAALSARRPGAIANWLQGEREYRRSRFSSALMYFRRSVADDSSLAFAALRGAEAAEWLNREEEARVLVNAALKAGGLLPPKYILFAHALDDRMTGAADSAVLHASQAIAHDSVWSEAWMALGEVYYHLLPRAPALDSLAEGAFAAARAHDPEFTPPLYHLAEIALRRGDLRGAERMIADLRSSDPDSTWIIQLDLMVACVSNNQPETVWGNAVRRSPEAVLEAAKGLAAAAARPACAEQGFRTVVKSVSSTPDARWDALVGLQSLLAAEGRIEEAQALLDSAVAAGTGAGNYLYVLDALAGANMSDKADEVAAILARRLDDVGAPSLWVLGMWRWRRGEVQRLAAVSKTLDARATLSGERLDRLLAASLSARLALSRGDTSRAEAILKDLAPVGTRSDLAWGLWEPLASERLLLAQLLFARGDYGESLGVASEFDYPQSVIFLLYLPESLALRVRAAERLGMDGRAERYRARLRALNRNDLLQPT
jgi:protein kinase-like protein